MANRYNISKLRTSPTGNRYLTNPIYPDIPTTSEDTYVITTVGDRYDTLAYSFYGDVSLWWIIASANTSTRDSLVIEPGIQLRIPANPSKIVLDFERFNENR